MTPTAEAEMSKRRETFWSALPSGPLPHTILPQMLCLVISYGTLGNHGYISISYPTPLPTVILGFHFKECLPCVFWCPHECVGPLSRHFCELEIKAHQFVAESSERRQSGWNCSTPKRPLSLLSISAVVVGAIAVVKMQMRTLTLYQDFSAQKNIIWYIFDGRKRLAFS